MTEETEYKVLNFDSHIAAAQSGCPICKSPMRELMAEKHNGVWRNKCWATRNCTGVMLYTIQHEVSQLDPAEAAANVEAAIAAELAAKIKSETKPAPPKEKKSGPVVDKTSPPVCEDWDYIANLYEWMTVEGKVVPIKKLPEKEFVDSVWAIIHANFAKVGPKMAWAKLLPTFGPAYAYPHEPLGVGAADAKEKLEEFYENAVERGWVTTGCE